MPDIQKTAELVKEISAASNEQNTGAEQINKALQQLEKIIQQNASASEEMASTSEELSSQAEQLLSTINFFQLEESGHAEAARPKRRALDGSNPAAKPSVKAGNGHATSVEREKAPAAPVKGRKNGRAGFAMRINDQERLDAEFERY